MPADGEARVEKHYGDALEATTLEAELAARDVGRLLVVGAQTDQMHPRDAPRRARARLRHDARPRRAHDRGPDAMGSSAARAGGRPHEPVLDVRDGAGSHSRDGRHRRGRLRPGSLRSPGDLRVQSEDRAMIEPSEHRIGLRSFLKIGRGQGRMRRRITQRHFAILRSRLNPNSSNRLSGPVWK